MTNYPIYPYGQGQTMPAGYPIANDLVTDNAQVALSAAMGVQLNEKVSTVELDLDDYRTFSSYINTDSPHDWSNNIGNYACKLIPVSSGETYRLTANANGGRMVVLSSDTRTGNAQIATGCSFTMLSANESNTFTIPTDGHYLYVAVYSTKDLTPSKFEKFYESVADMVEDKVGDQVGIPHIPDILEVGEPTNIIYTIDDFLLAHEYVEGSVDTLKASLDLGKTWYVITDDLTNDYGNITNAFFFSDGTLMFCTRDDNGCHAYWIKDFENMTVNETTIIDHNGNEFVAAAGDPRFYNVDRITRHSYANGIEYFCFGDYSLEQNWTPRLWYSCDYGRTIRCAFAFGISTINGSVVRARHIHGFCYNPYDGYFYAVTGDSSTECHVMRGRHDANHVWTWELIKTGSDYKFVYPYFDEGNLYCLTDYTTAELVNAKGIVSFPITAIDMNNVRYLFNPSKEFLREGSSYANPTDAQIAAFGSYLRDNHGWRIAGTDGMGNSKLMIAKNGHDFVWVDNDAGLKFGNWMGPNNRGDCYATFSNPNAINYVGMRISHRQSYNVTEMFRKSGMTDFFDGWNGTTY